MPPETVQSIPSKSLERRNRSFRHDRFDRKSLPVEIEPRNQDGALAGRHDSAKHRLAASHQDVHLKGRGVEPHVQTKMMDQYGVFAPRGTIMRPEYVFYGMRCRGRYVHVDVEAAAATRPSVTKKNPFAGWRHDVEIDVVDVIPGQ